MSSGFEESLRRFLEHFEKISNCADEDVFLKEFMVGEQCHYLCACVYMIVTSLVDRVCVDAVLCMPITSIVRHTPYLDGHT